LGAVGGEKPQGRKCDFHQLSRAEGPWGQTLESRSAPARGRAKLWSVAACCRFPPRELARGISNACTIPRQQAGWRQSGSKLPHSKASLRLPTEKLFPAALPDLSGQALPNPW
jgi:hypothetical protein